MAIKKECRNCKYFRTKGYINSDLGEGRRMKHGTCTYTYLVPEFLGRHTCSIKDYHLVLAPAFQPTLRARFRDFAERLHDEFSAVRIEF